MGVRDPLLEQLDRAAEWSQRRAPGSRDERVRDDCGQTAITDQLVSLGAPDTFEADQYRSLRHSIEWLRRDSGLHVLAVTSPAPGDGKTVTTLNLAGALAQSPDIRVLVMDADLRRPSVGEYLGLDSQRSPGLADALEQPTCELSRIVRRLDRYNLSVLPAGPPRVSPYELLNSSRFAALLAEARDCYDFVIIDTPPVVPLPDCQLIGKWVDGFLLIVTAHRTSRSPFMEALGLIDPARLVGVVFNGADRPRHHDGYYYYVRPDHGRARWWQRALSRDDRGRHSPLD